MNSSKALSFRSNVVSSISAFGYLVGFRAEIVGRNAPKTRKALTDAKALTATNYLPVAVRVSLGRADSVRHFRRRTQAGSCGHRARLASGRSLPQIGFRNRTSQQAEPVALTGVHLTPDRLQPRRRPRSAWNARHSSLASDAANTCSLNPR